DPGSGTDCKKGTSSNGRSSRAARSIRTGRPSPSAPENQSASPSVIATKSAIVGARWTPPTRSGAAAPAITQIQAPRPDIGGTSLERRPLRRRRGSLAESGCGASSSENPFVDDEDVTGENHDIG